MIQSQHEMFERAVVVVAHPDDEILWLSSILARVDSIVFCFEDCAIAPELGPGRRKVIEEYPLQKVTSLGIAESVSFDEADWSDPVDSEYGLRLRRPDVETRYQGTYNAIVDRLPPVLEGRRNVFTHNPWGEYGHEDHVQVYKAVRKLQQQMNFTLWFSNYCSQRSVGLMLRHVAGFTSEYVTLPTDPELALRTSELYKKHGCWTWYQDYTWFREECLMSAETLAADSARVAYGHIFPVNMLKTRFARKRAAANPFRSLIKRVLGGDGRQNRRQSS